VENRRFNIVFERLSADLPAGVQMSRELIEIREVAVQAEEIAELAELVADVRQPEVNLYTTT